MACLEILSDKPQTLEPGVTTWNMHDESVDYFYLIVIQLKETSHKPKANHQNFQVWKAKGYLVLLWKVDTSESLMQARPFLLSVWRRRGAVRGDWDLSEKNPCKSSFWIIYPCLIHEKGPEKEGKPGGIPSVSSKSEADFKTKTPGITIELKCCGFVASFTRWSS